MGRGRAKAKQTKVARELKYSTRQTDFDALQRDLQREASGSKSAEGGNGDESFDDDEYDDDDYRR